MAETAELRILAAFDDAIRGMQTVRSEMAQTAGAAQTTGAQGMSAGQKFAAGFAGASTTLRDTGRMMQSTGREMSMGVTVPLVAIGGAALKTAVDFDTSFTQINALVGISRDVTDDWKQSVLDMAGEVGKAPQELADALFFISSAGLRGQSALDALHASARASAAGLGDTATVADAATSAMTAYGESNLNAEEAVDVLIATVREGKLEPAELAGVLGRVIPIAAELGVEFHEVGAAVAAMSRSGLNAAEGTTALRQIMNALIKPTNQGREELEAVGSSYEQLRGILREGGLLSLLEHLRVTFDGNEEAMARVIPGVQGLAGFLNIMGNNAEANAEIFDNLAKSTGDLDAAFQETSGDTGFQMKQLMAELKVIAIELGHALIPFLKEFAGVFKDSVLPILRDAVNWFKNLPGPMQGMIVKGLALLAVVGPLLIVFGSLIKTVGLLFAPISMVAGLFVEGGLKATKFGRFVGGLGRAFMGLVGILKTAVIGAFNLILAHPIIAAIAAIIAIVVLLIANWEKVGPFFKELWEGVKNAFSTAWEFIKNVWGAVADWFGRLWDSVKTVFVTVINFLKNLFLNFHPLGLIIKHWQTITGFFSNLWANVQSIISGAVERIKSILGGIKQAIDNVIGWFTGLWDRAKGIFKGIGDTIASGVQKAKNWLSNLNPFARHSPSLVEQVEDGTRVIAEHYANLGRVDVDGPRLQTTVVERRTSDGRSDVIDVRIVDVSAVEPIRVSGFGDSGTGGGGGDWSMEVETSDDGISVRDVRNLDAAISAVERQVRSSTAVTEDQAYTLEQGMSALLNSNRTQEFRLEDGMAALLNSNRTTQGVMENVDQKLLNLIAVNERGERLTTGQMAARSMQTPMLREDAKMLNLVKPTTPLVGSVDPADRKFSGGDTYVVNNPAAKETESSLRSIANRRSYLGANGAQLRKTPTTKPKPSGGGGTVWDVV